tara:strand:- start:287 stop:484 length:198 start_codon:yes stop_codon:yes gene_type:complete
MSFDLYRWNIKEALYTNVRKIPFSARVTGGLFSSTGASTVTGASRLDGILELEIALPLNFSPYFS